MGEIKVGLIGGSGLGAALASRTTGNRHQLDTPFGAPSDVIVETTWANLPVFFLNRHGPGHLLNPTHVPYRANIFALRQLGCTHVIASGAVGSLREEYRPQQLVIPDQIIDKTHRRANTFFDNTAVHVEFAEPFCPVLRQILVEAATKLAPTVVRERGCYVCMEGPAFSTRAESLMHRLWGGDLIGMTAMPEAKLAREAQMSYTLVALVTDYDCWRQQAPPSDPAAAPKADPFVLLKEIRANLEAASNHAIELMQRAVELMATRGDALEASPARHALKLGIWSDKSKIHPEEVKRLAPLWMEYFEGVE